MKQANVEVVEFIAKARATGKSLAEVRELLVKSGWSADQVAPYLTEAGELVPPPPPAARTSGRDVFFYLLSFLTLGISAVSLGAIVFSLINYYYPDVVVADYYASAAASLRSPLASFVVGAPIFILVSWITQRGLNQGTMDARSKLRRVLTYVALFLAAATVIGDIIGLVYGFLAGQANTRFLLKVLTILAIGGWIIWYYWVNVRLDEKSNQEGRPHAARWQRGHAIVFAVVAVVALVAGFALTGNPAEQQKVVRDQRRVSDLQALYFSMQTYYTKQQSLPTVLTALDTGYAPLAPQDPATGQPYEYAKGTGSNFQLCATFEAAEPARQQDQTVPKPVYGPYDVNWNHPSGHYCFSLDAKQPKP